jgi:predicted GNAT family acetyltransferase
MDPIRHERADRGGLFLLEEDGQQVGELHYQLSGGRMLITHTEVAAHLRGGGLAQELVEAAARWARTEKLKILPLCSYAGAVLQRSPRHADLLAD